jgi:hypothetical protein
MNAKYASKPNFNPNEPNAAWPKLPASGWHLQAQLVGGPSFWRTPESRFFCWKPEAGRWKLFHKNKPNFFTTKYALLNQKRRKETRKSTQKNETNPIVEKYKRAAIYVCRNVVFPRNIPVPGGTKKTKRTQLWITLPER